MNHQASVAVLHPVFPTPAEKIGLKEYTALSRIIKVEAVVDFTIEMKLIATYKPVGIAAGWHWRDQKFHGALGDITTASIAAGGGAKSAVVTRADNNGNPTRPGRQFYELIETLRKVSLRAPNGQLDPVKCENAWLNEMVLLGYDITKL
jgi:hypothetical protein